MCNLTFGKKRTHIYTQISAEHCATVEADYIHCSSFSLYFLLCINTYINIYTLKGWQLNTHRLMNQTTKLVEFCLYINSTIVSNRNNCNLCFVSWSGCVFVWGLYISQSPILISKFAPYMNTHLFQYLKQTIYYTIVSLVNALAPKAAVCSYSAVKQHKKLFDFFKSFFWEPALWCRTGYTLYL